MRKFGETFKKDEEPNGLLPNRSFVFSRRRARSVDFFTVSNGLENILVGRSGTVGEDGG